MLRTLYYTVRVTAENEFGDRRTYDAADWERLDADTRNAAEHAGRVLAVQLYDDGYTLLIKTAIRAITSIEGR